MARIHHESFLFMYPTPTVNYSVMPRKTRLWILAPWASKEQPESPRAHVGRRSKGVFSSRVVVGGPNKKQQQCSAPTGYHSAYGQGTKLSNCLCLMILISLHFYLTRTILLPLFHFIWGLIRVAMQHKSLIHKSYEGHWQRPREDGKHSLLKLKRQIWTKYLGFVKLHFIK